MNKLILILSVVMLTGCAVVKVPLASGGSRSDGVVTMSYQYGMFELPEIDEVKTKRAAARKCAAWGYSNAEAFGTMTTRCNNYSYDLGCTSNLAEIQYQCTD